MKEIIAENDDNLVKESSLPAPGALAPMVAMALAARLLGGVTGTSDAGAC